MSLCKSDTVMWTQLVSSTNYRRAGLGAIFLVKNDLDLHHHLLLLLWPPLPLVTNCPALKVWYQGKEFSPYIWVKFSSPLWEPGNQLSTSESPSVFFALALERGPRQEEHLEMYSPQSSKEGKQVIG